MDVSAAILDILLGDATLWSEKAFGDAAGAYRAMSNSDIDHLGQSQHFHEQGVRVS